MQEETNLLREREEVHRVSPLRQMISLIVTAGLIAMITIGAICIKHDAESPDSPAYV